MKCEGMRDFMQRDLDHDLAEWEKRILQEHLLVCQECQSFQKRLMEIHAGLSSLPKIDPPFSLVDAILPHLEAIDKAVETQKRDVKKRRIPRWVRLASIAATIALIGVSFAQGMHLFTPQEKTEMYGVLEKGSAPNQAPDTFSTSESQQDQSSGSQKDQSPPEGNGSGQDMKAQGAPSAPNDPKEPKAGGKNGNEDQRSIKAGGNGEEGSIKNGDPSPKEPAPEESAPTAPSNPDPSASSEDAPSEPKAPPASAEQKKGNQTPVSSQGVDPAQDRHSLAPPSLSSQNQDDSKVAPEWDQILVWLENGNAENDPADKNQAEKDPTAIVPSPEEKRIAHVYPHEIRFYNLIKGEKIGSLLCEKGTFLNFAWNDENKVTFEVYMEDGTGGKLEYNLETKQSMQIQEENPSSPKEP